MECSNCNKNVKEVCLDGYCRKCHVSLSFEDCVSGTFNARILLSSGYDRQFIKKIYPKSNI